ncbi:MAG: RlmE family RNA methyltransferase [Candidatus Bathyarchaeota archaeon]|nr:MAG: RlmE family RNA methyltransferase [Candidatus Bathyarchaeota archaeon]
MSGRWLKERKSDPYYRRARELGYRSRAALKLKQLDERFGFFKGARRVLDLGAAPGGWLQVASESIDEDGLVVGVDLGEIDPLGLPNVSTFVGDVTEEETRNRIFELFGERVDVILSDMAPDVSGAWELDHYRQIHLARVALVIADKLLKEDGWMVVKTFQGSEHDRFVREMHDLFEHVRIVKPRASRKKSAEIYLVAKDLKTDRRLPEEFREEEEA